MKSTMKLASTIMLFAAIAIGSQAHAGFLLEPYLGYHMGSLKTGADSDDTNGVTYGGRLGYTSLGFMGGIDYTTGKWTGKADSGNADVTPGDLGVFVGYNFPVLLRAYLVYNIKAEAKSEIGGSSSTLEGNGIKLGVGFTTLPIVSINLEYIANTYDKVDGQTLTEKSKLGVYGVTISAPFDL